MKKVVLKLDLHDDKAKKKALKTVSALPGIDSIAMDMKAKQLTVVGAVDAITIVSKLRKYWPTTDIILVGPAKEPEKPAEKKEEGAKGEEGKKEEGKKEGGGEKKEEGKKEGAEEGKKEGGGDDKKKEDEKKPPAVVPVVYDPMWEMMKANRVYNPQMFGYNPHMMPYNNPYMTSYNHHMASYNAPHVTSYNYPNTHYVQSVEEPPSTCTIS